MRLIVAYDEFSVRNILDSAQESLKVIVTVVDVSPRLVEEADGLGIKIVRFLDIEAAGSEARADLVPPTPQTIATICFSRLAAVGTKLLGRPKVYVYFEPVFLSFFFIFLKGSDPLP